MATTVGPEPFVRPSPSSDFDSNTDYMVMSMDSLADSPPRHQPSPHDIPPPNPPFVFPAQPPPPSSDPSSYSRGSGRRPMSAIESPTGYFGPPAEDESFSSRSALPAFSFNPGALLPADPHSTFLLSPPVSPATPRNIPTNSRPAGHGHRRGGSEFVGGRIREGNSISVMSSSPTRSDGGFATPSLQPPPRRGHRRGLSGAISTSDLPILQPPVFDSALSRGNSAPTSPTTFEQSNEKVIDSYLEPLELKEAEPVPVEEKIEIPPRSPARLSLDSSRKQNKPYSRARVGFSDTLEFIPRPLSLVSNETSSTMTARPGHSVSGSISSIVSAASPNGRGSPAPAETVSLSRTSTRDRELTDSRPSTAGAILERTQGPQSINSSPRRRNSIPTLFHLMEASKMEEPQPSPTKTPKRWSFFAREALTSSSSPTKARPNSSSSSDSGVKASSSDHGSDSANESPAPVPPKSKKRGKKEKKKKVKGWAGAILPKKPKGHGKKSKSEVVDSSSAPVPSMPQDDGDLSLMDDPELLEPSMPTVTVTESPSLPQNEIKKEEETAYPMIDLDAALGPFNTPLPLNPEWEAAQRAAGNINGRRRLHSAQVMKGFSGPGMHYHRRAESAPDLPPFDAGRAGMHRFNSSSTMADVFEEDEEDDEGRARLAARLEKMVDSDSDATPPAVAVKDPLLDVQDKTSLHSPAQSVRRTNSSLSDMEQSAAGSVRAERSRSSLHDSIIIEEMPSVIFRSPNMFLDRSDNSESDTPSLRKFSGSKDIAAMDAGSIHLPSPANVNAPNSPYAMSHASSFPSPRSPMSVEIQQLSTAASSVTDENNFHSLLLMGEPGPEPTMRELRPVSMSSAAFGRRRSSLASLSRLINSSHGERSKLSMEVTMDEPSTKKTKSNSKSKRLSRMMQFWKSHKESASK
ncbi:hypothetical protein BGZ63DRAFT_349099 [Mariannaea sp. PMI_226]|nr:hypothetical protein BGZ63DRAFT_349099 [Mariannaea sp. PMI_226]